MSIEKLEELIKRVEYTADFINLLKEREKKYKDQLAFLSNKVDELNRENAELKDMNIKLKDQVVKSNSIYKVIEDRVSQLINKLPDIGELSFEDDMNSNNNFENISPESKFISENNQESKINEINQLTNNDDEYDQEFQFEESSQKSLFSQYTEEEDASLEVNKSDENIPVYIESSEGELNYENIFGQDDELVEKEYNKELPKGVL